MHIYFFYLAFLHDLQNFKKCKKLGSFFLSSIPIHEQKLPLNFLFVVFLVWLVFTLKKMKIKLVWKMPNQTEN